ncbi:ATP-dependent RNA helicase SUPV3L1/SUV3 [Pleomorphomonas diazotrophica]|nr:helicase-related protein [Pleomorphomonas diazotrophica]SFM53852.1 ATP-dependent RNA helicase SUPV3L1/SUV3 [Pleomorphomonas diazotrophica]
MNIVRAAPLSSPARARAVTAVLGPTNTGKTHLAIEKMLSHGSGAIGLPLRLLAREVYGRIVARVGAGAVALVTGEEKIVPRDARYWVATVEAMPRDLDVAFVAIDEVQLAGDIERGHVFTDRLLNVRGRQETMLLGSATARPLIERLLPGVAVTSRPRLSHLAYTGAKKITRLPPRSAIVAFSADEVYAVAELIRRQRGGAAVVMGALSPRTRNAQVALFQNGDVDFLVATDAIGMGLNLDVDHVAFAQARKFDGYQYRGLTAAELAQIAGRAGRYLNDGTFGVTGRVMPFDDDIVTAIEGHDFEPVRVFQWRNGELDFSSVDALRASLEKLPGVEGLTRALPSDDQRALDFALRAEDVAVAARGRERVALLWDVCQVPDFRKISPAQHGDLIVALYRFLIAKGVIPDDWFARQVGLSDRTDGDIDTLSRRLADIRTWTFVANRPDWLFAPGHWREKTRAIEDRLSDALHDRLTQRFVDRRTSVLLKRLRENTMLEAEITGTGGVLVEGQAVGELHGFRFVPDPGVGGDGSEAKALKAAAQQALTGELDKRAEKISKAPNEEIVLSTDGSLRWLGEPVGRLVAGDDTLAPRVMLLADEQLVGAARDKAQDRLDLWVGAHIQTLLKPLFDLRTAADLEGIARGVAFRMVETLGTVERHDIADDVKALDQTQRAVMRKYGVRFGAYHIYVPALLKPAPAALVAQLWALKHGSLDMPGLAELPQLSASGRTSIKVDPAFDKTLYRLVGFRVAGERAVRLDILERLADIIRPLIAFKSVDGATPPEGALPQGGGFTVTVAMTSLLGCSGEDFASILRGLGYRSEKRTIKVPVKPQKAEASGEGATVEAAPVVAATEEGSGETPAEMPAVAAAPADEPSVEAEVPVTLSEAPAESVASEGEAVATDTPAEVTEALEDREVDVWRPGRGDRPRHGDHRNEHRGDQRGERRGGSHRGASRPNESGEAAADGRGQRPQDDRRQDRRPQGDRREERRFGDRRDGRPNDRNAERTPERAPRKEKVADPNSPFAALAALKASLEQQKKK